MSEWSKEHAWKVCIPKGIEGSNPSLSARYKGVYSGYMVYTSIPDT